MSGKKRKAKTAAPVADDVGSAGTATLTPIEVVVATQIGVGVIVARTAERRGFVGVSRDGWIAAVTENLEDVGIESVVDFIRMVLGVNNRLGDRGHQRMHESTVKLMMEEACDIMFGRQE
jgi:hypothetical protein